MNKSVLKITAYVDGTAVILIIIKMTINTIDNVAVKA